MVLGRCTFEHQFRNYMIYPITVRYGRGNRENLIREGKYDEVGHLLHQPIWERILCDENGTTRFHRAVEGGEVKLSGEIYNHSGIQIGFNGINSFLHSKKLRAADVEEILSFGSQYPELQREFPIVAVGGVIIPECSTEMQLVALTSNGSKRTITTLSVYSKFPAGSHFLTFPDDYGYYEI